MRASQTKPARTSPLSQCLRPRSSARIGGHAVIAATLPFFRQRCRLGFVAGQQLRGFLVKRFLGFLLLRLDLLVA